MALMHYVFENSIDLHDMLDALCLDGKFTVLFEDASFDNIDGMSQCVEYDATELMVLRRVLEMEQGLSVTLCYNTLRLVETYAPDPVKKYIRLKTTGDDYGLLCNIKDGIADIYNAISSHIAFDDRHVSPGYLAKEISDIIEEYVEYTGGTAIEVLTHETAGIEFNASIETNEDLGRLYADTELDRGTVETLDEYVDWDAFGQDVQTEAYYRGFFTAYGYVFISR